MHSKNIKLEICNQRKYDMNKIDIDFDFRQDSKCGDPDTDSQRLYEAHEVLWNKNCLSEKFLI